MTEKDLQTRKQWLFVYIAYFGIYIINTIRSIVATSSPIENYPSLVLLLISLIVLPLFAYVLYRCAYQNPGTKLLT